MCFGRLLVTLDQKQVEVRGQRLSAQLSHHERDLTAMIGGMVREMLHQGRKLIAVVRTGSILAKDSLVRRFTNSIWSLSTSAHFNSTAATSGNALGVNRASWRAPKPVRKAEPGDGSCQYLSQPHSPPMMCTSVSRTERKLPPRSRVNCSASRLLAKPCGSPSGRIQTAAECHYESWRWPAPLLACTRTFLRVFPKA
jgi:hypothetical protein